MSLISTVVPFMTEVSNYNIPHDLWLACTALLFRDANGGAYAGRTMELTMELPYVVTSIPKGHKFSSVVDGHKPLKFQSKYGIFAIAVPNESVADLKIVEGVNEEGLTFSVLAFSGASGPAANTAKTKAMLAAIDLGAWVLAQFASAADVKEALGHNTAILTALVPLHGAKTPFHFVVHDRAGKSIVIEFSSERQNVYDNPVGVMTNGPEFTWHLTNLNNYTFLTNLDQSKGKFGDLQVSQPDSGIATAGLPASNTSVGRFVRAAYYSTFAEKPAPEKAVRALGHMMNNFDRPRGITIDPPQSGGLDIESFATEGDKEYESEYTSWTVLGDLTNNEFYIRTYDSINFIKFDLKQVFAKNEFKIAPLDKISAAGIFDVTDIILK
ncbi:linear amide C-N hydrolase [Brucella pseudogrignonensis]|uniref:Penicillin V acylase-like amidase (Ntn superfamily) n=1 Tax=Brucella pseudogrignonensis TaxID=419475 RepID=A0ABU1M761_9HYPH|nr:linear amide C-N hydrolase [Brucella pseudogrignonensis]MDR6431861.1 penicillin V acylase-like amidase (Ntn superfamily) [Brucella pseudogrignonensis]